LLNVKSSKFSFHFEFLKFFLLLVLLLLEGAYVVTPLLTNSAKIGGEPTAKELGRARPNRFQSSLSFSLFFFPLSHAKEAVEDFAK
jgi:hypothetical protein